MKVTDCQCAEPGWCERHQCEKPNHWFEMCRRRKDYFQAWEEGRGPGQEAAPAKRRVSQPACVHRGLVMRETYCPSCLGHIRLKVFQCPIHGECTLAKQIDGAACCSDCLDYESINTTQ